MNRSEITRAQERTAELFLNFPALAGMSMTSLPIPESSGYQL
ncbi:hypothetical protein QFZ77_007228 [Paenibacillus sp. V4I3]|nr:MULTISPECIES: hypothetical protein [unclassified Paenibacillus]MDQ0878569.1 hypothetical protein [Paenibacillus sp. V4I3]MDQ0885573.1 hypothetical protein [Paenibacillus sp. V4I9]